MPTTARSATRRTDPLTRARIVDAAIALLDERGEDGLTYRALAARLATGAGALYGHVADRDDLLTAACDAVVARTLAAAAPARPAADPRASLRAIALALFDALDAHPWVGSALARAAGQLPVVRIVEALGRHVSTLAAAPAAQWSTTSALLHYIVGVGGQNAANAQAARGQGADRAEMLHDVATTWSHLDPGEFPFARAIAGQFRRHDDRADFAAGVDLFLAGLAARG